MTPSRFFRYDDCARCGDCLHRCPYMDLSRSEAVAEIGRLVDGRPTRVVHDACVSCFACDTFCPHDCHPYELVLEAWHERYLDRGLPARAAYLLPASRPNFRSDLVRRLSTAERALVDTWAATPPEGDLVIYPGCNAITLPHLLDVPFLRHLPVSGSLDLCCGEMYYRMGLFEMVERTAERLTEHYRHADVGTMLFVCPAGLHMFRTILPERFGASFPFEMRYLGDYLLEQIEAGGLDLTHGAMARRNEVLSRDATAPERWIRPLASPGPRRSVAVHDSCHGRVLGDEILSTVRSLYRHLGLELRELADPLEEGLCCGMAAGCRRYRPDDILLATRRALTRARATHADELAVYCGGCQLVLTMLRGACPGAPPVRHLMELLAEATGTRRDAPVTRRALRLLGSITTETVPALLSRDRIRLDDGTTT